jgi:hypothetical protein
MWFSSFLFVVAVAAAIWTAIWAAISHRWILVVTDTLSCVTLLATAINTRKLMK